MIPMYGVTCYIWNEQYYSTAYNRYTSDTNKTKVRGCALLRSFVYVFVWYYVTRSTRRIPRKGTALVYVGAPGAYP